MGKIQVIREKPKKNFNSITKQKLIWTVGHFLTLVCGVMSILYEVKNLVLFNYHQKLLFLINRGSRYPITSQWDKLFCYICIGCYRLSLIGAILSHSITLWQSSTKYSPTYYDLLSTENFQNLLMSFLWLFSRKSIVKLFPFVSISYFHLTNRENILLLKMIAYSEILLLLILTVDTLLFKDGTSGFLLIGYTSIYWLRLNFSGYTQTTLLEFLPRLDSKVPMKYRKQWKKFKLFIYTKMMQNGEHLRRCKPEN